MPKRTFEGKPHALASVFDEPAAPLPGLEPDLPTEWEVMNKRPLASRLSPLASRLSPSTIHHPPSTIHHSRKTGEIFIERRPNMVRITVRRNVAAWQPEGCDDLGRAGVVAPGTFLRPSP